MRLPIKYGYFSNLTGKFQNLFVTVTNITLEINRLYVTISRWSNYYYIFYYYKYLQSQAALMGKKSEW